MRQKEIERRHPGFKDECLESDFRSFGYHFRRRSPLSKQSLRSRREAKLLQQRLMGQERGAVRYLSILLILISK